MLIATGRFTAAFAMLRLQHEAVTRSIWLIYAASALDVAKLAAPLSKESDVVASKLPMMAEMLKQLAEAPSAAQGLAGLQAFKINNAPALNSFVHGGIHALQRQEQCQ